jgi:hypothetical protein
MVSREPLVRTAGFFNMDQLVDTLAQLDAYLDACLVVEEAYEQMDPWVPQDDDLEVRLLSA